MDVFIRRNGLIIGAFDREEFFNARTQGGILDGDEWCNVGGDVWRIVGSEEPFLRRSEEKRQKSARTNRMISEAMNDSYNFKVWYSRVSHRAGLHDSSVQPDAPSIKGRSFLSRVSLVGFGAFSEAVTADFSRINPDVRRLSPLCSEWLSQTGLGKTSLGRAIEMVRNVTQGLKLRKEDLSYLHRSQRCKVTLEFQFIDGIDSAELVVWNGIPAVSASPRVHEALARIKFVTELGLDSGSPRNYLESDAYEVIRSGWLSVSPGFPVLGEGILDEEALRHRLANPRMSERILAELLLLLREAEANELTLILERPFACLDLMAVKDALKYLSDASLRGANQVLLLNDARREHVGR